MLVAFVSNNVVVGIADLTPELISQVSSFFEAVVDVSSMSPTPAIGWEFDGQNIVGTSASMKITRLAMNQRFTVTEMLGLLSYVNSNPNSIVALLMKRLEVATFIDLARTDTQGGVMVLVSLGLLTSPRATAILTTPPTLIELYTG